MAHPVHAGLPHEAVARAHNIWEISSHWPIGYTLGCRARLSHGPIACVVAFGQLVCIGPLITQLAATRGCRTGPYHRNIWAISSHWPIAYTLGCRTRLSQGPIACVVVFGQLVCIGPLITQLAAARGCRTGPYYHNIWAISSHWPISYTQGCCTRLSQGPIACVVVFGQLVCIGPLITQLAAARGCRTGPYHCNIWAISSHWPIAYTLGCRARLSHGPISCTVIFGKLARNGPSSAQWIVTRDCRMGMCHVIYR